MLRKNVSIVLFLALVFSCTKAPITGRRQMKLLPESELMSMAATEYQGFLSQSKLSTNTAEVNRIKSIGQKLARGTTDYLRSLGHGKLVEKFNWEFNLVDDPSINAWCMPGGKIVFYTGILPVCANDNGIAVVMGHEIAHAVAGHGNERMSQGLLATVGQVSLAVALANQPADTRNLFMAAFGVGAQVGVMLPFSRMHESEADKMGLFFAAYSGYDPQEAVPFWQRMAAKGGSTPEFLSTHPSSTKRSEDLRKIMPDAMKLYNARKP